MRQLVRTRIREVADDMVYGGAIKDFAGYREFVGVLRGLAEALELIDEAERKVDEAERGK